MCMCCVCVAGGDFLERCKHPRLFPLSAVATLHLIGSYIIQDAGNNAGAWPGVCVEGVSVCLGGGHPHTCYPLRLCHRAVWSRMDDNLVVHETMCLCVQQAAPLLW